MAFQTSRLGRSGPVSTRSRRRIEAIAAAAAPLGQKIANSNGGTNPLNAASQAGIDHEIWKLFDAIPELRTAARITGQAMSQCRLVLARLDVNGVPTPLDVGTPEEPGEDANHPGIKLLGKFAGGAGGQTALLDALGVFLTTTGEAVLVGKTDPTQADPADDFDRIQAYSTQQVRTMGRQISVQIDESSTSARIVDLDEGYDAIRIWRPHPCFNWRPDSATRSSLSVLREIAMYDDRIQATGQSRLAGRGLLFVDENLTLPVSLAEDEPHEDGSEIDPFMELLMEVMGLAMADPSSAAAMVPILIRAPDVEKAAKLIDFSTPFDDAIESKREAALKRFAVAVDMPPEILTGFGALQHWTGALVSEDWKNSYLSTLMGFVCGGLTQGWYLPALAAAGYGDIPADTILWYDDSAVRTREDTAGEATAAYDRGEISGDTYRRAIGYSPDDAPSAEELLVQVLKNAALKSNALAPIALAKLAGTLLTESDLSKAEQIKALTGAPSGGEVAPTATNSSPAPGSQSEPASTSLPASSPALRALAALAEQGRGART